MTVAQKLNGNHTIFYNQAGDSSGTITLGSLQSVARRTGASRARPETRARHPEFTGAASSPTSCSCAIAARPRSAHARSQMRSRKERRPRSRAHDGPARTSVSCASPPARRDGVRRHAARAARRGRRLSRPQALRADQAGADGQRPACEQRRPVVPVRRRLPQRVGVQARRQREDRDHRHRDRPEQHRSEREARFLDRLRERCTPLRTPTATARTSTGIAAAITNNALGFAGAGYNVRCSRTTSSPTRRRERQRRPPPSPTRSRRSTTPSTEAPTSST